VRCSPLDMLSSLLRGRIDQALRVTDLLLQAGGFSAIVLDMGSIAPADALRVPLATWFRYRAAAERTQASILLLTQHPCAKSSVGLLLRLVPGQALQEEATIFTGLEHRVEVTRERFQQELSERTYSNVLPIRKPPQSTRSTGWKSQTHWAGVR
jgi:recombination protein RecA